MSRLQFSFSTIVIALLALMGWSIVRGQEVTVSTNPVVVVRKDIITTAPVAKEVIAIPAGYTNCFTVAAGWYKEIWVPEHRICQYTNTASGAAWIEGYWACTKYKMDTGECTDWSWKTGHWQKTLEIY